LASNKKLERSIDRRDFAENLSDRSMPDALSPLVNQKKRFLTAIEFQRHSDRRKIFQRNVRSGWGAELTIGRWTETTRYTGV
jgi:hypothetical protein